MRVLGLDIGTTRVKALLADARGHRVGQGTATVDLIHGEEGAVQQELEDIWRAVQSAIRDAVTGTDVSRIRALGVSSQGGALQFLDANGTPQGRVISWLDGRGARDDQALTRELGADWFVPRVGHCGSGTALGQLLRVRREQPAHLRPPARVGFVGDSIVARLCGRFAHEASSASIALLYNPRREAYDPDVLARLSITPSQLPDLLPVDRAAGGLLPEAAKLLGLPAGIAISAALHDQYAAALGCDVLRVGQVMLGAGTAWVLLALADQLLAPVTGDAFVGPHPVRGLYGQILSLRNGGSSVSWARQFLGLRDRSEALDERMSSVPPGCEGVVFRPFLAESTPGGVVEGTAGQWDGLRLKHGAAHALRSVVEGLAFELNRHLDGLVESGFRLEQMVMTGGGASGRVTPQIVADVTGLPVACLEDGEAGARGAAMVARGLVEPGRSLPELAAAMIPSFHRFYPGPDRAFYRGAFQQYLAALPMVAGITPNVSTPGNALPTPPPHLNGGQSA